MRFLQLWPRYVILVILCVFEKGECEEIGTVFKKWAFYSLSGFSLYIATGSKSSTHFWKVSVASRVELGALLLAVELGASWQLLCVISAR